MDFPLPHGHLIIRVLRQTLSCLLSFLYRYPLCISPASTGRRDTALWHCSFVVMSYSYNIYLSFLSPTGLRSRFSTLDNHLAAFFYPVSKKQFWIQKQGGKRICDGCLLYLLFILQYTFLKSCDCAVYFHFSAGDIELAGGRNCAFPELN